MAMEQKQGGGGGGGGSDMVVSGDKKIPAMEQFQKRYQSFKASKAPAIHIDEIKHVFDVLDEKHDGLISKDDLHNFLARLGFSSTEEEITSMLNSVDVDGDGSVDFKEFATLYQSFSDGDNSVGQEEECEEDLQQAFQVFDKNADGLISAIELQDVLVNLGIGGGEILANCEQMIRNVDVDGNGSVDFSEFKKMMDADVWKQ